jgi:hypothetical protein
MNSVNERLRPHQERYPVTWRSAADAQAKCYRGRTSGHNGNGGTR